MSLLKSEYITIELKAFELSFRLVIFLFRPLLLTLAHRFCNRLESIITKIQPYQLKQLKAIKLNVGLQDARHTRQDADATILCTVYRCSPSCLMVLDTLMMNPNFFYQNHLFNFG